MKELAPAYRYARIAGVVLLGILSAAIIVEGILRLTDRYQYDALTYDPATGLIHYVPETSYPSTGTCYDLIAHINNLGFYGPDVGPKQPGVYRVIVMGSSFAEAIQVPLTERFDTIATNDLNKGLAAPRYEVISIGFPNNGNYLTMIYYRAYVAALHPDLVIDLMTDSTLGKDAPNTVDAPRFDANGSAILELPSLKRDSLVLLLKSVARRSHLFEALYEKYTLGVTALHDELHPDAAKSASGATDVATWDTEAELFASFKPLVESSGAKFAVASWTTDDTTDRTFMKANLAPIATSVSFPLIDLTAPIDADEVATGASAMLACNGHWGEDGNRWAGELLAAYIRAHAD